MTGRCLHGLPSLEGGGQTGVRVSVEQLTSPECSISLSRVLEDALGFVLILSLSPANLVGSPTCVCTETNKLFRRRNAALGCSVRALLLFTVFLFPFLTCVSLNALSSPV